MASSETGAGERFLSPALPEHSLKTEEVQGMAKSGHTFAKRKREQEKKAKAAAKRARRAAQKQSPQNSADHGMNEFGERPIEDDSHDEPDIDETPNGTADR